VKTAVFIEPLDLLFPRGNKLFGDPGSYGEALVPPWPSAVAGALRSRMLVDAGLDPKEFAAGKVRHESLGTVEQPGPFTVTAFHLARRYDGGQVELLVAPPADLVVFKGETGSATVAAAHPRAPAEGLASSADLPQLAVLPQEKRKKPAIGYWLTESGWKSYLAGQLPSGEQLVPSSCLWRYDERVGVGLDPDKGRAREHQLFSVQGLALVKRGSPIHGEDNGKEATPATYDVGFLVEVKDGTPPTEGLLRFGGDGRGALLWPANVNLPEPDFELIASAGRCRLVLTTPGIFQDGWLPPGVRPDGHGGFVFELAGVRGRLVAAAVPRFQVVSGWDLARWRPKPAQRAAPAGSVYWLEDLQASPEALEGLVQRGLWDEPCPDPVRRAEGFNRFTLAPWMAR